MNYELLLCQDYVWVAAFSAQPKGMADALANHPFAPLRSAKGCHPFRLNMHQSEIIISGFGAFAGMTSHTIRLDTVLKCEFECARQDGEVELAAFLVDVAVDLQKSWLFQCDAYVCGLSVFACSYGHKERLE